MGKDYTKDALMDFIESLAVENGISVSKLGELASLSDSTLRYWRRRRTIPRKSTLDQIENLIATQYPARLDEFKALCDNLQRETSDIIPISASSKEVTEKMDIELNGYEEATGFILKSYKTQFKDFYVDIVVRHKEDICEIWLYHVACTAKDMLCAVHISDVLKGYSSLAVWLDSQLYSIVDSFIECYKTENKEELANL